MKQFRNFTRPSTQVSKRIAAVMTCLMMVFMLAPSASAVMVNINPSVDAITAGSATVKGQGYIGSTVTALFPNGASVNTTVAGTADQSAGVIYGPYSINVPTDITLKAGDIIKLSASTSSGQNSETISATVGAGAVNTEASSGATPAATASTPQTTASTTPAAAPNTGSALEAKNPILIMGIGVVAAAAIWTIARSKKA